MYVQEICIFILVFIALSHGFNLDTLSPVIHTIPESGSLFGFSVAQHSEQNKKWLIIGAPNANRTGVGGVITSGAVYRCPVNPVTNPGGCQIIDFDAEDTSPPSPNVKDDQWLGATVGSAGPDGIVVACAPRFVWSYSPNMQTYQDEPIGRCHTVQSNFNTFASYSPCLPIADEVVGHSGITHCQAGMSLDIDRDNNRLLLGAPGSFYWQGQGILLDLDVPNMMIANNEELLTFDDSYRGYSVAFGRFSGNVNKDYVLGVPRGEDLQGLVQILTDLRYNTIHTTFRSDQMGSYFGQSIVVSDFNGDNLDDLVIGAPLYVATVSSQKKWDAGQVYIYYQDNVNRFSEPDILSRSKSKARFGFSLAALGDINLDNFNDLAVGAPYDGDNGEGLVYIYLGHAGGIRKRTPQIIKPADVYPIAPVTFGYSLSGGMDMDGNNYTDVLVGSAYSDTVALLRSRPIVKLYKVNLFVEPEGINLDQKNFSINSMFYAGFNVTTCFAYKGNFVPSTIFVAYTLKLDSTQQVNQLKRALFVRTQTDTLASQVSVDENNDTCVYEMAYIKNDIRDKVLPMTVTTEYKLLDQMTRGLPVVPPILSTYTQEPSSTTLYFVNNCPNNVCIPELVLSANALQKRTVIGGNRDLAVNVSISNNGQSAFQSTLNVFLPVGLQYDHVTNKLNTYKVTCNEMQGDITHVTCDIGNPMPENYMLNFDLVLSTREIKGDSEKLNIEMSVVSHNPEPEESYYNNAVNITIDVDLHFNLTLKGISRKSQLKYDNNAKPINVTTEEQIGPEVEHFYEIRNTNESSLGNTELVVLFPMKNDDGYLLYLTSVTTNEGVVCDLEGGSINELGLKMLDEEKDIEREDTRVIRKRRQAEEDLVQEKVFNCNAASKCMKITCLFREIKGINAASNKVTLSIKSRLWNQTFVKYETSVDLISVANVTVLDVPYAIATASDLSQLQTSIQVKTTVNPTELSPTDSPVSIWIYVGAIVGGLVLFLVLVFLLWKCGFFKRKKYQTID